MMDRISNGFGKGARAWVLACAMLLPAAETARAVDVRIATMNVCNLASDTAFTSLSNILQRVQPDVLAMQECSSTDEEELTALMARLSKPMPHRAFMQNPGTGRKTASGDKVAIYSAWPIVAAAAVKENYHDPDAVEFMRWPIHAKIEVPGALNPLHVVTLHAAASTVSTPRRIWRGLEARRVREYVEERILGADENDVEYVVLGDFNDSAPGRWNETNGAATFQEESFTYAQFRKAETNASTTSGFGGAENFVLGRDHPWYVTNASRGGWTMPYRTYPTDRFGDMQPVAAFQTGSASNWVTDWKGGGKGDSDQGIYRLDYILFSSEIMASSYGAPEAEVYYSAYDDAGVGLPKPGPVPPKGDSTNTTDHLLVFSDFHMIDEVGGITPVAILSEIAHHAADPYANFVEICNTGNGELDLSGYSLELYLDDATTPSAILSLDGVNLGAGGVYWIAGRTQDAAAFWGTSPDAVWDVLASVNGSDTLVLRNDSGAVQDIYGAIGIDGSSKPWCYADSAAVRDTGITDPMATWHPAEWTISTNASPATATPGRHTAVAEANVSLTDVALRAADRDSTAPLASDAFRFGATATPNLAASNLEMEVAFRVNGGSWITNAMTNVSGHAWSTPALNVARSGGSVMDYRVAVSFDGAGDFSPVLSSVLSYTFPAATMATNLADVLVNEVKTSGTTNEFVELVGAADLPLSGWALEWYGADAGLIWRYDFPDGAAVSAAGLQDEWTNSIGFYVVASPSGTPNRDAVFTNTAESASAGLMADAPRVLVLRNAGNAVVDAVALASTNDFVQMAMPGDLSTDVARGAPNYLHCLGATATDETCSRQAPGNVRTGCTADGLYELPDWCATNAATPGALNCFQTNYCLRLARVDRDADGLLDDLDNCPSDPNTAQADTDHDGYGDVCDEDIDGDGVPNGIDNCPTEYNPRQEDYDADGVGNACDPDFVEEDWAVDTLYVDFENAAKGSYTPTLTNSMGGREWILSAESYVGATASDRKIGKKALRTRTNTVLTLVGTLTNGLDTLSFFHGAFGSDTGTPDIVVETAPGGGADWVECWRLATSTNFVPAITNFATPIDGGSAFRIRVDGGASNKRLNIDNILLVAELPSTVSCELAREITVERDGLVHTNEFYVFPSTATWSVSYADASGGTTDAPTAVGTYSATVSVDAGPSWAAAVFDFPASLTITEHRDPPEILETAVMEVSATVAKLAGTVVANTTNALDVRFEYGTSAAFGNIVWAGTVSGQATNLVDCTIENLHPETRYYWRIHVGDVVGGTCSFTTDSLDRPAATATAVGATEALLSWDAVEGATNYLLTAYSISSAGASSNISVNFQDWTYVANASSSVSTQKTASGDWTFSGLSIANTGQASGIGSKGYAYFATNKSWLRFPALAGVSSISVRTRKSRRAGDSTTLQLLAITDGGASSNHVETFSLATTTAEKTHAWSAGQADGTVFLLYCPASGVYLYDIAVATAATAEIPLPGMPASLAGTTSLLSGLDPVTTYYVEIKAQGRGWETEWSVPLEITTSGSGKIPSVTVPAPIPDFSIGVLGSIELAVTGDPMPEVGLVNPDIAGLCELVAADWDDDAKAGTWTFSYLPAAGDHTADGAIRTFLVAASNACGGPVTTRLDVAVATLAPNAPVATSTNANGFTVEWPSVPGADWYCVVASTDSDFATTNASDILDAPSWTLTGLAPGTTYHVRAATAYGDDADVQSAWSPVLAVTTAPAQSPEQAFAQWLADRFDATPDDAPFAATNDVDSDGMTTWQEFLADTCPTDAASRLKLELKPGTAATQTIFRFDASTGRWYQLVYWTNLLNAPFTNNLGHPTNAGIWEFETNFTLDWYGSIRVLLDAPTNTPGN